MLPKLRILITIARSSNGRTADSESVNLGSNPGLAALRPFGKLKTRQDKLSASHAIVYLSVKVKGVKYLLL
jgi:hypothetical protein